MIVHPNRLDDPCILFALRRESAPFRREFRPRQAFPGSPCWARFCGPAWRSVLVVETGVGQAKVARVLDWLLTKPSFDGVPYEPRLIVFAGFAGALTDGLHVGDVVLADEVVEAHGHSWRTTWSPKLPEGRRVPPLHRGRLLSVDRLIATPEEKHRLGRQHQACAVDMESALFAAHCTQAGIPFACVRAISDEVATPLSPALTSLLSGSSASPWRVLKTLAWHPGMLPELLRLARATKRASTQLGLELGELLTLTLPGICET
jgi:adenosylhomocysteine nucleosidase